MDERDWLARRFEDHRGRLRAVAYRMLGSASEADDAVQEAWLRLSRSDADAVENLGGWLTTVVARVCLNMLEARRSRREEPVGGDLPDPVAHRGDDHDPEQQALAAEGVGLALLDPDVVLRADPAAVRTGAAAEVRGAAAVAGTFSGRAQTARPALVDGVTLNVG